MYIDTYLYKCSVVLNPLQSSHFLFTAQNCMNVLHVLIPRFKVSQLLNGIIPLFKASVKSYIAEGFLMISRNLDNQC